MFRSSLIIIIIIIPGIINVNELQSSKKKEERLLWIMKTMS